MERRNWTRDELLATLSLYAQLPFGKMHRQNDRIIRLATKLDRTPSAVALKLVNFASFDPEHQDRGVKGMQNTSKLDREVWDEFYGDWEELSAHVDDESVEQSQPASSETERESTVTIRRGQSFFRQAVLSAYGNMCCVTQIRERALLRASHIVPWANDKESRLNPANGLALNALHDCAFDRGFMTLDEKMRVVFSSSLRDSMTQDVYRQFFEQFEGQEIMQPERFRPLSEFTEFHRTNVFVDSTN